MPLHRTFLLSPASCRGERARLLFSEDATCLQAKRVRSTQGLPVGELFSFLSGLYFRGKLAYAQTFANPAPKTPGVLVITPTQGLLLPDQPVTLELMREFSSVDIKENNIRYRSPFEKDARILDALIGSDSELVLLGSIATRKYLDVLCGIFRDRLSVPAEFVGRGDMSRGALLLRCVQNGRELHCVSCSSAVGRGSRPPKIRTGLAQNSWGKKLASNSRKK